MAACGGGCDRRSPRCLPAAACGRLTLRGSGLRRRPAAASRVDGFIAIRSSLYSILLRPRVRGAKRPLLCLVADALHGDRKRPRRNAHHSPARRTLQTTKVPFVKASTSTTSLMSRARRRPAAACGGGLRPPAAAFEVRLEHHHLTIVEASKRTFARTLPSLVSCEAVSRQRR